MGTTSEGAQYMVLDRQDMETLEIIATRMIEARGGEYIYQTKAGVKVTFTPNKENDNEQ